MARKKIHAGDRFGRLTVTSKVDAAGKYVYLWTCLCDCGNETTVRACNLRTATTTSCGCLRLERLREAVSTHGKSKSTAYSSWCNLTQRCTNPKSNGYKDYGARGISVCAEWLSFDAFYADMGDPPEGMSIERKNVNLGYSKNNCIWADKLTQSRNTRANKNLTYGGETLCLSAWAERLNIGYWAMHARLRRGWSADQIIETPLCARRVKPMAESGAQ